MRNRLFQLLAGCRPVYRGRVFPSRSIRAVSTSANAGYSVEMASSNIRFGYGATDEIGMDLKQHGVRMVCVVTDKNIEQLAVFHRVIQSLRKNGVAYSVFNRVRVEPDDKSWMDAIAHARQGDFDGYVAVGGGSVIDTCKVANLYACHPEAELLDFVNAPIGRAKLVNKPLKPLFAIPTTAGTGSETTGMAIFDYHPLKTKTGVASRAIRPTLGILDPLSLQTLPERVTAYSGLDVLCHAIESFTAIPYTKRQALPSGTTGRPIYQGSNPISDVWSREALRICSKYLVRAVFDSSDTEARTNMFLASTYAGIGFGNAGVHLCHGMSYPISGLVKNYREDGYPVDRALVPHGLSVIISAPAVFEFTAPSDPDRHLEAARLLGADTTQCWPEDAGPFLGATLRKIMKQLKVPDGISSFGYTEADIPALVAGTLPQERVLNISPVPVGEAELASLFKKSLKVYD